MRATRTGEARPTRSVPETFLPLLAAFQACFSAPSHRTFGVLVAGWARCVGGRTVTGVVVAAEAVGSRHSSVFPRFFGRAEWSLDGVGRVVFSLALGWVPADWALAVLVDATLARTSGTGVSLATIHHAPPRSSARTLCCSFGHAWVVLALWVPLPMGARGFGLPLLFRRSVGAKRGGQADAPGRARAGTRQRAAAAAHAAQPRPTKLELARALIGLVAVWAGESRRVAAPA